MRAIPRALLIHTVTLNKVNTGRYGDETDVFIAKLEHVRVEPSNKKVISATGEEIQLTATLFIDAANSTPKNIAVSTGQSVVWEGQRYKVEVVERLYDTRKQYHHMEVGLHGG